jgi:hypothetical protein
VRQAQIGLCVGLVAQIRAVEGTAAQQEDVIVQCRAAEPSYGETWQSQLLSVQLQISIAQDWPRPV